MRSSSQFRATVLAAAIVALAGIAHAEGANPTAGTSQSPAGTDNSTAMPASRDANTSKPAAKAKHVRPAPKTPAKTSAASSP